MYTFERRIIRLEEANALAYGSLSKSEKHNFDFIPFKMRQLLDDEIRLKVLFTGINQSDLLWANGTWLNSVDVMLPCVPGHEIIGEIITKGKHIWNFEIGDIVAYGFFRNSCGNCKPCLDKNEDLCMKCEDNLTLNPFFGGWATHFQAKAKFAHKIPKEIPLELCPPLLSMGVSLYSSMKRHVKNTHEVCIVGMGEIGHMAARLADSFGCKITVITSTAESVKEYSKEKFRILKYNELSKEYKQREIDIIYCCVNEGSIGGYVKLLKKGGTFINVLPVDTMTGIDMHFVVFNSIKIEGAFMGSNQDIEDCLKHCAKNKIFPNVEIFEFDEFPKVVHKIHYENPKFRFVVKCVSKNYPQFND